MGAECNKCGGDVVWTNEDEFFCYYCAYQALKDENERLKESVSYFKKRIIAVATENERLRKALEKCKAQRDEAVLDDRPVPSDWSYVIDNLNKELDDIMGGD